MQTFDDIWQEFSYIIEEMQDGMCFFEGYILDNSQSNFRDSLLKLSNLSKGMSFDYSSWANDTTEEDWNKIYSIEEYIHFFDNGKITTLCPEYQMVLKDITLHFKLLIDNWRERLNIEIICYRAPILDSTNPKLAVKTAIEEFWKLKELFEGKALFVGPDTLDYPINDKIYPEEWIKIIG